MAEGSARVRRKSLAAPDEHRTFPFGNGSFVDLGSLVIGHAILQPGWRWSSHIKPNVGTTWCRIHHLHLLLAGRFAVELEDGERHEFAPMDVMDIPPGHDAWVVGDDPVELIDISGNSEYFGLPAARSRTVGTMLMTDIVSSTELLASMGDAAWKQLLATHDRAVRHQLERFGGREVKTTGDGFLTVFPSAGAALMAAVAIHEETAAIGIPIRAGVHTGEIEEVDDDIRGIAVHAAARVLAAAEGSQVIASAVTRSLAEGTDLRYTDLGEHSLKGLAEPMRLFSVEPSR